jgi:plasmid stabilization system protein ParE
MTEYAFHPQARDDLGEIWDYIAADNPDAADRIVAEILEAIRAVVPFPDSGHRRPDLTAAPLRFLVVREYLIAYAPNKKPLWVIAVMHGHRHPRVIAAMLKERD